MYRLDHWILLWEESDMCIDRDATPRSGKIRKFGKYQKVAKKRIKWSIVVLISISALI